MSTVCFTVAVLCLLYGLLVCFSSRGGGFYIFWLLLAGLLALAGLSFHCRLWSRLPTVFNVCLLVLCITGIFMFLAVQAVLLSACRAQGRPSLDYLLVAGAQVWPTGPCRLLRFRLDRAITYLNENPETRCIVTGGQGRNEHAPEARVMADYLMAHGIARERLLIEDRSVSTAENLRLGCAFLPDGASLGIVTNSFHVYRALQLARQLGLTDVCGIAAHTTPLYLPANLAREFFAELLFLKKKYFL